MRNRNKRFSTVPIIVFLLLGLLFAASCAKKAPLLKNLSQLKGKQAVLVGRIELNPPLGENEQDVNALLSPYKWKNAYFAVLAKNPVDYRMNRATHKDAEYINERWGNSFYAITTMRPVFVNQPNFQLELQSENRAYESIILNVWAKVDYKPGDRAVYIGTLLIHRNEFWDVVKFEVVDDYAKEKAAFESRFGKKYPLVKRLAVPVNP